MKHPFLVLALVAGAGTSLALANQEPAAAPLETLAIDDLLTGYPLAESGSVDDEFEDELDLLLEEIEIDEDRMLEELERQMEELEREFERQHAALERELEREQERLERELERFEEDFDRRQEREHEALEREAENLERELERMERDYERAEERAEDELEHEADLLETELDRIMEAMEEASDDNAVAELMRAASEIEAGLIRMQAEVVRRLAEHELEVQNQSSELNYQFERQAAERAFEVAQEELRLHRVQAEHRAQLQQRAAEFGMVLADEEARVASELAERRALIMLHSARDLHDEDKWEERDDECGDSRVRARVTAPRTPLHPLALSPPRAERAPAAPASSGGCCSCSCSCGSKSSAGAPTVGAFDKLPRASTRVHTATGTGRAPRPQSADASFATPVLLPPPVFRVETDAEGRSFFIPEGATADEPRCVESAPEVVVLRDPWGAEIGFEHATAPGADGMSELTELLRDMRSEMRELSDMVRSVRAEVRSLSQTELR